MDNLDLNIDNYSLEDLLNLFKIDWDYGENELKSCKKMVLMTHPDKSQLDKKFFLFFKKAYSIIFRIYETKSRTNKDREDFYSKEDEEYILRFKKSKNFNKIFNKLFDKYKIKEENDGYGDWLLSNDDCTSETVHNTRDMNELIEAKKRNTRAIVKQTDYNTINSQTQFLLDNEKPEYYSSDIFSKLGYDDLKRAHVESVVPVTNEDYENKPKFKSDFELNSYRKSQDLNIPSMQESNEYLRQTEEDTNKVNLHRIYKLTMESEKIEEINKKILGQFKQLTN